MHGIAYVIGDGSNFYITFFAGDGEMEDSVIQDAATGNQEESELEAKGEKSHLIIWEVALSCSQ